MLDGSSREVRKLGLTKSIPAGRQVRRTVTYSLSFAAGTDRVAVTTPSAQNDLSAETVFARIYIRSNGASNAGRIITKGDGLLPRWRFTIDSAGLLNLYTGDTGQFQVIRPLPKKRWISVGFSYQLAANKIPVIYVNGVPTVIRRQLAPSSFTADTTKMTIGNESGATRGFDGLIAEVRRFNTILTKSQMAHLHRSNIVPPANLISEYLLNEGSGTTAVDSSASANNGTITAATYSTNVFV
jgi:hypothetical protein